MFHAKNTIICLVLEVATLVWLLPQADSQNSDMASKQPEVIEVPDDNPDDFPNSGPQNPVEAQSYRDKLDAIMDAFSDLLAGQLQRHLEVNHHIPKEVDGEALVADGRGQCGGSTEVHP